VAVLSSCTRAHTLISVFAQCNKRRRRFTVPFKLKAVQAAEETSKEAGMDISQLFSHTSLMPLLFQLQGCLK
jgi:Zn-dependent M28 family amino/carboxypeptidase